MKIRNNNVPLTEIPDVPLTEVPEDPQDSAEHRDGSAADHCPSGLRVIGKGRGKPFQLGNTSGRGRPRGSRNKTTLRLRELLDESGEAIFQNLIADALGGDKAARRLCVERLIPPVKDSPIEVEIGPVSSHEEAGKAREKVLENMARGELTPAEAKACMEVIDTRTRSIEDERDERNRDDDWFTVALKGDRDALQDLDESEEDAA
jgi:hypothetical protein